MSDAVYADEVEFVGLSEIADRLGVTRQAVWNWRRRGLLPPPVAIARAGALYDWPDVETWAKTYGYPKPRWNYKERPPKVLEVLHIRGVNVGIFDK